MAGAIDSIFTTATNPGGTYTATAATTGDSLTVRNFPQTSAAYLEGIIRRGATAGAARVRSPRLHDNVTGINGYSAEVVDLLSLPFEVNQPLYSGDTLIAEVTGGGAETDGIGLQVYYSQLPGAAARLASWGDIAGIIRNVKMFQVAVTNSGTIGAWTDTVITTTENQLHADTDYAVLGYRCSVAQGFVGVKGQETGNLRVCGPGAVNTLDTEDYFIRWSAKAGYGAIPVFNSNNRNSVYVSTCDVAASTTPTVTLVCAELSQPAPV